MRAHAGRLFHPWGTSLQALLYERDEIIVGQTIGGWSKGFHSIYLNRGISVSVPVSVSFSSSFHSPWLWLRYHGYEVAGQVNAINTTSAKSEQALGLVHTDARIKASPLLFMASRAFSPALRGCWAATFFWHAWSELRPVPPSRNKTFQKPGALRNDLLGV